MAALGTADVRRGRVCAAVGATADVGVIGFFESGVGLGSDGEGWFKSCFDGDEGPAGAKGT